MRYKPELCQVDATPLRGPAGGGQAEAPCSIHGRCAVSSPWRSAGLAALFAGLSIGLGIALALPSSARAAPDSPPSADEPAPPSAVQLIDARVRGAEGGLSGANVTVTFSTSDSRPPAASNLDPGQTLAEVVYPTDATGNYRIEVPAALVGDPQLRLTAAIAHPDYLTRTIGPLPVQDFQMQTIDSEQPYWLHRQQSRSAIRDALLRRATLLAGRVLLPDGSPAAGAKVTVRSKYRPYSWKFHDPNDYTAVDSAVADEQGRFSVACDDPASMTIDLPGEAPLIIDQFSPAAPPGEFRLPPGFRFRGRVLSADDKPIPGAIVSAVCTAKWNEFNQPVVFGHSCASREDGSYELPPLPAGRYTLRVSSRLTDRAQIADYNRAAERADSTEHIRFYKQRDIPRAPLADVILDETKTLGGFDESTACDLQGVETVTVTVRLEFPDGGRPDDGRQADLTVHGLINGQRWSGNSVVADEQGIARLIVPRGVQNLVVGTGLAYQQRTADGPVDIGEAIHLGTVTEDVTGLVVRMARLAKLRVEVKLPVELARRYSQSKAFININAFHARDGYREHQAVRQRIGLVGAMQSNADRFRGLALPHEEIVLQVTSSEGKVVTLLHEERLILAPGEELLRKIEIADR